MKKQKNSTKTAVEIATELEAHAAEILAVAKILRGK